MILDKHQRISLDQIFLKFNSDYTFPDDLNLTKLWLERLAIHRISHIWDFFVIGHDFLSVSNYKLLNNALIKLSGNNEINLQLKYENNSVDAQVYESYYPLVISKLSHYSLSLIHI